MRTSRQGARDTFQTYWPMSLSLVPVMVAAALATMLLAPGWGHLGEAADKTLNGRLADIRALPGTLSPAPMAPDTLRQPTANTTKFVWGSMGDSLAAGEGNPEHPIRHRSDPDNFELLRWGNDTSIWVPILGQNGQPVEDATLRADTFTCHRSDEAGAPKANRRLRDLYPGVTFLLGHVACSGARTEHLFGNDSVTLRGYTGPNTRDESMRGETRVEQPPQIDRIGQFMEDNDSQLDAVYMSIGANDMGFDEIVKDCASPGFGDCLEKWETLLPNRLANLRDNAYRTVSEAIDARLGADVKVFISQIHNPLHLEASSTKNPPVCQGPDYDEHGEVAFGGFDDFLQDNVTTGEAAFAFAIPERLNEIIRTAAANHGWTALQSPFGGSDSRHPGHGMCADNPFANLNSAALRYQGHDLDDTFIFSISGGILHPNDAGYAAFADVILDGLRPGAVDPKVRTGLHPPTRLRIAGVAKGSGIRLRWDDRATSENAYEIEVVPARPQDVARVIYPANVVQLSNGGFRERVRGIGLQEYLHVTGSSKPGLYKYRVRACNTGISSGPQCGTFSDPITGANFAPSVPTGLTSSGGGRRIADPTDPLGNHTITLPGVASLAWSAQPEAIEYVLRIGGQPDVRTQVPAAFLTTSAIAPLSFKVAACNRVGCSNFASAP